MQAPLTHYTVYCDLRSAHNCTSSSLRPSDYFRARNWSTCTVCSMFFLVFFFFFFSALPHCFWLADPTRNIEKKLCGISVVNQSGGRCELFRISFFTKVRTCSSCIFLCLFFASFLPLGRFKASSGHK